MSRDSKILDICQRFGEHQLTCFFRELETAEKIEMLNRSGHGEALEDWFKEAYPDQFQTESAEDAIYWNDVDFRYDSAAEEKNKQEYPRTKPERHLPDYDCKNEDRYQYA